MKLVFFSSQYYVMPIYFILKQSEPYLVNSVLKKLKLRFFKNLSVRFSGRYVAWNINMDVTIPAPLTVLAPLLTTYHPVASACS